MDLRAYERRKFQLAEIVRAATALAPKGEAAIGDASRDVLARLAEDRFNVVVVGRFNRGKTSVMNALLGTTRLPTGVVPVTSAITTVTYGSDERAQLRYEGGGVPVEVPLDELPAYVTERGNPGNVRKLSRAEVELPIELLRRGVFLIDTPGLGSPIAENTQTTLRFLPEADALLLVTSYESPLSEEEDRLLELAAAAKYVLFVVVNKQDLIGETERAEVLDYVHRQVQARFGSDPPRTFSVSASDGVGIPALSAALLAFFTTERANATLTRLSERVSDLVHAVPASPKLAQLLKELHALDPREAATSSPDAMAQAPRFGRCSACERIIDAIFAFLRMHQHELTVDRAEQQAHAERGGLCHRHTWQYESLASPRGTALAYPSLLHRFADRLAGGEAVPVESRICGACAVRDRAEREAVAAFASRLEQAGDVLDLAFCVPHLELVAAALDDDEARTALLRRHGRMLERLAEDLQRFALRTDALRRHLLTEEERRAPQQALALTAGERNA